jgi:hypothetical protein
LNGWYNSFSGPNVHITKYLEQPNWFQTDSKAPNLFFLFLLGKYLAHTDRLFSPNLNPTLILAPNSQINPFFDISASRQVPIAHAEVIVLPYAINLNDDLQTLEEYLPKRVFGTNLGKNTYGMSLSKVLL